MTASTQPTVSVILLNYNGSKYVEYWRSLFSLDYPTSRYEIVFVDNGSRDGSGEVFAKIASQYPDVHVKMIKLEQNCGYSMANNIGASKADGEYVVLLSNDIEVSEEWMRKAVEALESDHGIGAGQSLMYTLDRPTEPDRMGNYIDVFGMNHPFSPSKEIKEVFYSEGAVMFIRQNVIEEAGGLFDADYFMFYEDVDFCWRLRLMGYKIVVFPLSVVYHKRGGTVSGMLMKTDPAYVFTNTRNRLRTLFKNYSTGNMLKFVPATVAIETTKGFLLLLSGKAEAGTACFRALFSFTRELKIQMKKRANVQIKRKVNDEELLKLVIPPKQALKNMLESVRKLQDEWKKT